MRYNSLLAHFHYFAFCDPQQRENKVVLDSEMVTDQIPLGAHEIDTNACTTCGNFMRLHLEIELILVATVLKKSQENSQSSRIREWYVELIVHSDLFCSGISAQGKYEVMFRERFLEKPLS